MGADIIEFDHFRRRVEQINPDALTTVRLGPGKRLWIFDRGATTVITDAEEPPQWVLDHEAAERSRLAE